MKQKVAHILHAVGGVDVSLRLIVANCNASKFETIIIHGLQDSKTPYLDSNKQAVKEYKLPINREISLLNDLKAIYKTIRILKNERPTIIHSHSAKGGIIARVASLFYKVNVLHTPQAYSYLSEPKGIKRSVFLGIEKMFKHFNSILVASSNSERNRGIKEVKYKDHKALLFNNCINPIEVTDIHKHSLKLPDNYICTVGRPSFQKNIEMMIEVIKKVKEKYPKIHLVLMGVGEYSPNKKSIETLIDLYGLHPNVTMIPWIEREKIFSIVNNAKLYISTARYEGLPYSVIEALALGKLCVVTDCDGNRDLIKNKYNGYVVPQNDVESMANCIFALLADEPKRKELGENALAYFEKHHDITTQIKKLEAIYSKYSM